MMNKPLLKLFKKIRKKYFAEVILLTISLIIACASIIVFLNESNQENVDLTIQNNNQNRIVDNQYIYIDVQGAINKPDLYKVKPGARIKQLIDLAGGLSENADLGFFRRNFNQARILFDQEKIYIPSSWETSNDYFVENKQFLNLNTAANIQIVNQATDLININNATIDELITLPGIGNATGEKIINSRPYTSIEELYNKKVVNKSVFNNIKNLISVE